MMEDTGLAPMRAATSRTDFWRLLGLLSLSISAFLTGCAVTTPGGVPIDTRYEAKGQDSRALFLVLHYTVLDLPMSVKVLTQQEVSAHYLLSDESPPKIYRLVPEERRAWHAGPSFWKGNAMLNAGSIGIEIVNRGWVDTPEGRVYAPFPKEQIDALIPLVKDIVKRHQIPPERVLGHSDIAPTRKQDPGPQFPWKRLADEGLVLWPDAQKVAEQRPVYEAQVPGVDWFQRMLTRHGFQVPVTGQLDDVTRSALSAFQMKYRNARYDGQPDGETAALLHVLTQPAKKP